MPANRRDADRLGDLAKLQKLRTMRDEQALSQANDKFVRSQNALADARKTSDLANSAVDDLIGSSEFLMDELRLLQAVAHAHETEAAQASHAVAQNRATEQRSREKWHISRHQLDVLHRGARTAKKYLSRKKHEQAESDLRDRRSNSQKDTVP